jgi:SAM-dependent methyltransferase
MTTCIVCGSTDVKLFLDLGVVPLANKFLSAAELSAPEPTYPLRVGFCTRCTHVQLMDPVPPPAMFEDYLYISGTSSTLREHLHDLAAIVVERRGLGPHDLVVDVGSNDGTLLSGFREHGVRTLGVDPARNLAAIAAKAGVETYTGFFGAQTAQELVQRVGQAAVITMTNTFPHIPDLADLMAGVEHLLRPGGTLVIEAHYLMDLLTQGAFDTIYHEHVSFWGLGPMQRLFRAHGMQIVSVERLPLHHGQVRVFVQRTGERAQEPSVERAVAAERAAGLDRFETFEAFAKRAYQIRLDLKAKLAEIRAKGKRIAAYGAPAKGSTLISFLGLDPTDIPYIADRSPLKQGRFVPGAHIPIVDPSRILEDRPDYLLLLAWNFADEIMAQQVEFRRAGGAFVVPLPEVHVVR